jgi:aspartate aminotransferase
MFKTARRLKNVKISASSAMTDRARELRAQGVKIVSLSSGEPDFATPPHAIEAAHQAALAGGAAQVQARQWPRLHAR